MKDGSLTKPKSGWFIFLYSLWEPFHQRFFISYKNVDTFEQKY